MYAKAQCINQESNFKIPVETYENRDIINAIARKNAQNTQNCSHTQSQNTICQNNFEEQENIPQNHCCHENQSVCKKYKNSFFDKLSVDDLLLIGIILLLLFDGNDDCDFLIPILIAVILFN